MNSISDLRRGLMLEVIAAEEGICPLMFHLHRHYPKCDQILFWLKKNKIVGKKLLHWIREEQNNSPLQAFTYILRKIEADKKLLILHGKDFVT